MIVLIQRTVCTTQDNRDDSMTNNYSKRMTVLAAGLGLLPGVTFAHGGLSSLEGLWVIYLYLLIVAILGGIWLIYSIVLWASQPGSASSGSLRAYKVFAILFVSTLCVPLLLGGFMVPAMLLGGVVLVAGAWVISHITLSRMKVQTDQDEETMPS